LLWTGVLTLITSGSVNLTNTIQKGYLRRDANPNLIMIKEDNVNKYSNYGFLLGTASFSTGLILEKKYKKNQFNSPNA